MILTRTPTTAITHTPDLTPSDFRINATREAFEILSGGLYSNRPLAILRELGTNALDSHIAAGTPDRPIHVVFPTDYSPRLTITDYGTGMTHDTVTGLYSTYFASSKTTTNDQTGAFGLGSKTPLSMFDAFTVDTRTPSETTGRSYIVSVSDHGTPTVTYLGPVDISPGTRITIETGVDRTFEQNAREAFRYFPTEPETNLTGGLRNDWWYASRFRTSDNTYYAAVHEYSNTFTVIQGPVGYTVRYHDIFDGRVRYPDGLEPDDYRLIFTVPMGTLRPSASRETISLTPSTKAYLRDRIHAILLRWKAAARLRLLYAPPAPGQRLPTSENVPARDLPAWLSKHYPNDVDILRRWNDILTYKRRHVTAYRYRPSGKSDYQREETFPGLNRKITYHFVPRDRLSAWSSRMKAYLRLPSTDPRHIDPNALVVVSFRYPQTLERAYTTLAPYLNIVRWSADDYPRITTARPSRRRSTSEWYRLHDPSTGDSRYASRDTIAELMDTGTVLRWRHQPQPDAKPQYTITVVDSRERRTKVYRRLQTYIAAAVTAHRESRLADLRANHTEREILHRYAASIARHELSYRTKLVAKAVTSLDGNLLASTTVDTVARFLTETPLLPDDLLDDLPASFRAKAVRLLDSLKKWVDNRYPLIKIHRYDTVPLEHVAAYIVGCELTLNNTPHTA